MEGICKQTKLEFWAQKDFHSLHPQPENCEGMAIVCVNSEIWAPLNASKRKADLHLANMQQALQKATFAVVITCDKLLVVKAHIDTKEMLTNSTDALELVGHVASKLSSLRLPGTFRGVFRGVSRPSDVVRPV